MKKYLIQYKPFLQFLGKFFLVYFILLFFYTLYIRTTCVDCIDEITKNVAFLTKKTAQFLNLNISIVTKFEYFSILYNNVIVARIIEGCNAISVIILFVSFVVAFSGKLKQTIVFVLFGSLIIYILNIIRIVLLSVLMFYYPEYEHILHGVVFPFIIYGSVFILWVIWVNKFSNYAK